MQNNKKISELTNIMYIQKTHKLIFHFTSIVLIVKHVVSSKI